MVKGNERIFLDGVITCFYEVNGTPLKRIYLNADLDQPLSLNCVKAMYDLEYHKKSAPFMVIYEDALDGEIYCIGNHDDKTWEKVGKTCGYA